MANRFPLIVNTSTNQVGELPSADNLDLTGSGIVGSPSITDQFMVGAREKVTVSPTAATGTINFDYKTQSVLYYTSNASGNWTLNVRGDGSTALNSIMAVGDALTIAFITTQGGTAYYQTGFQIDGSAVTPTWQGGAPTKGNASGTDHYTITIVKTASATFTVFAAQTQFKA